MRLHDLPEELLHSICECLDHASLCTLRLSSRAFCRLATALVFREVEVTRRALSVQRAERILESDELRQCVREISLYSTLPSNVESGTVTDHEIVEDDQQEDLVRCTQLEDSEGREAEANGEEAGEEAQPEDDSTHSDQQEVDTVDLDSDFNASDYDWEPMDHCTGLFEQWSTLFQRIRACPRLVKTTIHFPFCWCSFRPHKCMALDHVLRMFMESLVCVDSLRSIDIWLLQGSHSPPGSEEWGGVLSRLHELHLDVSIDMEEHDVTPLPSTDNFFRGGLQRGWLAPLQQNLTVLSLWSDSYWGFYPFCDLRGLSFKSLKELTLCRFSFAWDWQLEWIFQHSDTLHKLYLETCAIVVRDNWRSGEMNLTGGGESQMSDQTRNARWSDYFPLIHKNLTLLDEFIFVGDFLWASQNEIGDWRYLAFEDGCRVRRLHHSGYAPTVEEMRLWDIEDNAALEKITAAIGGSKRTAAWSYYSRFEVDTRWISDERSGADDLV